MQFGEISDMCLIGRTSEVVQNLWFPAILRKIVEKFRTLSVVVSRNANSVVIISEKIIYHMNAADFDVLRFSPPGQNYRYHLSGYPAK